MGSGTSSNRVVHEPPVQPLPVLDPLRYPITVVDTPPPATIQNAQEARPKPRKQDVPRWPLPPDGVESTFETNRFTDHGRHALRRAAGMQVSSYYFPAR